MPALPNATVAILSPPNPHLQDNPDRLKEIDAHIQTLRATLKYFEDERSRITAVPADAHPVGMPEILGYIMEWGIYLEAFDPETLLLVSRHWHNTAMATPAVWSRIVRKPTYLDNFSQFLIRCKKYLDRSKACPLYIEVDFLYMYIETSNNSTLYGQFSDLIEPHLARCYHLSLANPTESLSHLLSQLGPSVEHIAHYCATGSQRGPMSMPDILPNLRHLSGTFPVHIFANIQLPVLEHLQIAFSPVSPTVHDLLNILQRCPNLKCLLFDNVSFSLAVEPDLTNTRVELSNLLRLEFHCSGSTDPAMLFGYCSMPAVRELCVTGNLLPIPLQIYPQITSLHCGDVDFPWFVRALRVATQLESLNIRSHGQISQFHTDLLPTLGNSSASSTGWLAPKLKTIRITSMVWSEFPTDQFVSMLRRRAAYSNVETIQKLVLEDVSHLSEPAVEQLKSVVEHLEIIRMPPHPVPFPFFPAMRGRSHRPNSPSPIMIPPIVAGAPIVIPPIPPSPRRIIIDGRRSRSRSRSRSPIDWLRDGNRSRSPTLRRDRSPLRGNRRYSRSPVRILSRSPPRRVRIRSRSRSPVILRSRTPSPQLIIRARSPHRIYSNRHRRSRSRSPSPYRRRRRSWISYSRSPSPVRSLRNVSPLNRRVMPNESIERLSQPRSTLEGIRRRIFSWSPSRTDRSREQLIVEPPRRHAPASRTSTSVTPLNVPSIGRPSSSVQAHFDGPPRQSTIIVRENSLSTRSRSHSPPPGRRDLRESPVITTRRSLSPIESHVSVPSVTHTSERGSIADTLTFDLDERRDSRPRPLRALARPYSTDSTLLTSTGRDTTGTSTPVSLSRGRKARNVDGVRLLVPVQVSPTGIRVVSREPKPNRRGSLLSRILRRAN